MQAYMCTVCGFLYDDESADKNPECNIIPFEELDFDWTCPNCGTKAELFKPTTSIRTEDIEAETKD